MDCERVYTKTEPELFTVHLAVQYEKNRLEIIILPGIRLFIMEMVFCKKRLGVTFNSHYLFVYVFVCLFACLLVVFAADAVAIILRRKDGLE